MRYLPNLGQQEIHVFICLQLLCRCRQSVSQHSNVEQSLCNGEVGKSQPANGLRRRRHTGTHAVVLSLIVALAPTALGTRVVRRIACKTGDPLKVPKMVEKELRPGSRDMRNQLELFGTCHCVESCHEKIGIIRVQAVRAPTTHRSYRTGHTGLQNG